MYVINLVHIDEKHCENMSASIFVLDKVFKVGLLEIHTQLSPRNMTFIFYYNLIHN
jgi:hypothetical protein